MVVGQLNKKIAFVIQARIKSKRLPGKVMLPIPLHSNKPILLWIIEELKKSSFNNEIIVATSRNVENDIIESFCIQNDINCFRGDEENVLSRFINISKVNNYDCIVRLTADNPLIDSSVLDEAIRFHLLNQFEYTNTIGLPIGMNFELVLPNVFYNIDKFKLTMDEKEHVTLYIKNNSRYFKGSYKPNINPGIKNLRLTIDYPSDYTLISTILSMYNSDKYISILPLIEDIYLKYPWLFQTNNLNIQKQDYR
jgi:spore coat polysaccharide biosynthesis protein SpsF